MNENNKKKSSAKTIVTRVFVLVIFLCIGGGAGYAIGKYVNRLSDEEQKLVDEYRLLKDDWLYGNETKYIDQLAAKGLIEGVASNQGDSYTFYTSTHEEQGLSTDGKGFGFVSHYYDGGLYVRQVYTTSTAKKANLQAGDVLYGVKVGTEDYYDFKSHTLSEINSKLSSVNDTETHFVFSGKRTIKGVVSDITIDMTRGDYQEDFVDLVTMPSVDNDYTMTVKVNTFLGNPSLAMEGYINSVYKQNLKINTLIIDLRDNGGGYVSQASALAKLFVKKGTLIYQLKDKDGNIVGQDSQDKDPTFQIDNFRLILNSGTASASEIFTLAMLDGTSCDTYGFTSYGKGIAQNFKTFSDGSEIRYTYAYVYGPSNGEVICIHKKGITPTYTYPTDYSFLSSTVDYSSIGISEYGQKFFLKVLDFLYPGKYPTEYSSAYHFVDAIEDYAIASATKYSDDTLKVAFNDNGGMLKSLNDILNKEIYDAFLSYDDKLTSYVQENAHDRQ
jgi:carboxyl-terminal processing protease